MDCYVHDGRICASYYAIYSVDILDNNRQSRDCTVNSGLFYDVLCQFYCPAFANVILEAMICIP